MQTEWFRGYSCFPVNWMVLSVNCVRNWPFNYNFGNFYIIISNFPPNFWIKFVLFTIFQNKVSYISWKTTTFLVIAISKAKHKDFWRYFEVNITWSKVTLIVSMTFFTNVKVKILNHKDSIKIIDDNNVVLCVRFSPHNSLLPDIVVENNSKDLEKYLKR